MGKLMGQFSEVQMANKHMKKCSKLLDIKKMLIKMTVIMAIIKKTKFWQRCGDGEKHVLYTVDGNVNYCSHHGN
jgi:hypothetical protein